MSTMNIYDMADEWNDAGTTFTAIKMNVTDTASDAASLLLDLQVGSVSKANVGKDGKIRATASAGYSFTDYAAGGIFKNVQNGFHALTMYVASIAEFAVAQNGVYAKSLGLASVATFTMTPDVFLHRDAANILALRNSTSAQTFRIYNTYTDASNYERAALYWSSNMFWIKAEAAGTGTAQEINIAPATRVQFVPAAGGSQLYITPGIGRIHGNSGLTLGDGNSGLTILSSSSAGTSTGSFLQFSEMTAPSAPSSNAVRIYAEDDGAGKTRLMALFPSGAAQQIAIEP